MRAITTTVRVHRDLWQCGNRGVSKIQRVLVDNRSVRHTGPAPTGDSFNLIS